MTPATWAVIITASIAVGALTGCLHYYIGKCKRLQQDNDMLRDTIDIMRDIQREWENDKSD